jgi:hypothetical protein
MMNRIATFKSGILGLALALGGITTLAQAMPAPPRALPLTGTFAVILHRGGAASWLSHNHLIVADAQSASSEGLINLNAIETSSLKMTVNPQKLIVDDPNLHSLWIKRLRELAILDEDFKTLDDDDRNTVRTEMLSDEQLDSSKYTVITGEVLDIKKQDGRQGSENFNYQATLRFTVHGMTKEIPVKANITKVGSDLKVEAVGSADLNDFGIKPISIMLGAIKVLPSFDLYANFTIAGLRH